MDRITLELIGKIKNSFGDLHKAMGLMEALAFGIYVAENTTVKSMSFDDGFERAHENPETEQPCTFTALLEVKGDRV